MKFTLPLLAIFFSVALAAPLRSAASTFSSILFFPLLSYLTIPP